MRFIKPESNCGYYSLRLYLTCLKRTCFSAQRCRWLLLLGREGGIGEMKESLFNYLCQHFWWKKNTSTLPFQRCRFGAFGWVSGLIWRLAWDAPGCVFCGLWYCIFCKIIPLQMNKKHYLGEQIYDKHNLFYYIYFVILTHPNVIFSYSFENGSYLFLHMNSCCGI